MKKVISAVLIAMFCSSPLLAGRDSKESRVSSPWLKVGFDATYVLFGAYLLNTELKVGDNMSLVARGGYIDTRITINSNVNQTPGTFGKIELGARWYLSEACMQGFFLDSRVGLDFGRTHDGNAIVLGDQTIGPSMYFLEHGIYGGHSWVSDIGFFIDSAVGVKGYVSWGVPNPPVVQWSLIANMNFGWAF